MKKRTDKASVKPIIALALSLALLAGCAAPAAQAPAVEAPAAPKASAREVAGVVLLSINPEIEVRYDSAGLVLEVEGVNEDGRSVVREYAGYEGQKCDSVVNELVERIYEAGYFVQTADGRGRNIVIKLQEGSRYPEENFLEGVAQRVRDTVTQYGLAAAPMTVGQGDLDDKGNIGLDKAKELVLAQLGLNGADFVDKEYKLDDGVYELEFTVDGIEYEFELDARTGKVLEADFENNDDWDDDDDLDDNDDDDRDDDDNDDDRDDDDDDDDWDDDDDDGDRDDDDADDDDD